MLHGQIATVSINSILGNIHFYLTWDLNGCYSNKVSAERNEDDIHTRTLWLGSRKSVVLVPSALRRYMFSDQFKRKPWNTDNVKDNFVKIDKSEQRCPGWFNGSVDEILDHLIVEKVTNKYPFQTMSIQKCYVNFTFEGHTNK